MYSMDHLKTPLDPSFVHKNSKDHLRSNMQPFESSHTCIMHLDL